jgi:hypothetical protein
MRSLTDENAEYSRSRDDDGAVRPTKDTGFRMPPRETVAYVPKRNPPTKVLPDHIHEDDILIRTPARGLLGVNYITINQESAEERITNDIKRNIARG